MGFLGFLKKDGGKKGSDLQFGPPPGSSASSGPGSPDDFEAPPAPPEPFQHLEVSEEPVLAVEGPIAGPTAKDLEPPVKPQMPDPFTTTKEPLPNPFEAPAGQPTGVTQPDEDLDIPDLPDEVKQEARAPVKTGEETGSTVELPPLEEPDAQYMPEKHAVDSVLRFVESHTFYGALQDVKAGKKGIRDADDTLRRWLEGEDSISEKADALFGAVDSVQEQLMIIDAQLFER